MSKQLELLKLSGTFLTAHGGRQVVHGIATVMRSGMTLGVMFGERGEVSTFEAIPVRIRPGCGVALISATVSGNLKSFYTLKSLRPEEIIAGGTHLGCHLVDNPPLPELLNGSEHISAMLKQARAAAEAPFGDPTLKLELTTFPWQEVYQQLNEDERWVADVVVWVAMFNGILGPDAPHQPVNFFSAVTFRVAAGRIGADVLAPWAVLAAEPVGG